MSIRLLRAEEVPETSRDLVFRASRMRAVVFVAVCIFACVLMILLRWPAPRVSYYVSAGILLLLLFVRRFVTARFTAANWLVRVADEGLFIHYRSYLNDHLSAEDLTVVFVPYSDIHSARLVRERVKTLDSEGATQTEYRRWIDLELTVDCSELARVLDAEYRRPAVAKKRWWGGTSATLYRDYPVLMQTPPFLRIRWQVRPGPATFLDAIRSRVPIAPTVKTAENFADLKALPRNEQEKRLRELDQRGERIAAVYMATRLYSLDLSGATRFIESLRGGEKS